MVQCGNGIASVGIAAAAAGVNGVAVLGTGGCYSFACHMIVTQSFGPFNNIAVTAVGAGMCSAAAFGAGRCGNSFLIVMAQRIGFFVDEGVATVDTCVGGKAVFGAGRCGNHIPEGMQLVLMLGEERCGCVGIGCGYGYGITGGSQVIGGATGAGTPPVAPPAVRAALHGGAEAAVGVSPGVSRIGMCQSGATYCQVSAVLSPDGPAAVNLSEGVDTDLIAAQGQDIGAAGG